MEEVKSLLLAFHWCSFRPLGVDKRLISNLLYIDRTIPHVLQTERGFKRLLKGLIE